MNKNAKAKAIKPKSTKPVASDKCSACKGSGVIVPVPDAPGSAVTCETCGGGGKA
ncbi:MAG TPA: hypothetical protein VN516_09435 [Candidatus Baltobacteraceae bacterium]|nr:hypothetical protein [Candidatus Baltobacteraceae bacterium]